MTLVASIVALLVGPALAAIAGARGRLLSLLDGFVLAALVGLVAAHLLPQSFALGGGWAALAAVVGLVLPPWIERSVEHASGPWHRGMLGLAIVGLAVHAMLDGAALASEADTHGGLLTLGVLLHRIPVGLTVWWAARPRAGRTASLLLLGLVAAGTAIGYLGAEPLFARMPVAAIASFQALVAGSLLHVVVGHEPEAMVKLVKRRKRTAALGAFAGAAVVVLLELVHRSEPDEGGFVPTFVGLARSSAPALLAAIVGASIVHALSYGRSPASAERDSVAGQALRGVAAAARTALCSCDVAAGYTRLVRRGTAPGTAAAFLLAVPSLGLDAILVSIAILGVELAGARLLAVVAIAWLLASTLGARWSRSATGTESSPGAAPAVGLAERLRDGLSYGFGELTDHVLPWFTAGLAVAGLLGALLPRIVPGSWLADLPAWSGVIAMALAGLGGYSTASAAMPPLAVLVHHGLSPGAALAFLLTAPVTGAMTLGGIARMHGRRAAVLLSVLLGAAAVLVGLGYDAWSARPEQVPTSDASILHDLALAALVLLLARSFVRQGPRALIGRVVDPHEDQLRHEHEHEHDHGQEHGAAGAP